MDPNNSTTPVNSDFSQTKSPVNPNFNQVDQVRKPASQIPQSNEIDFNNYFILNGKQIYFRKWKVKDKLAINNAKTLYEKQKALVYNCLKEYTPLDSQEYEYALIQIRNKSVKKPIRYTFQCSECGIEYEYIADLDKIISPKPAVFHEFYINNKLYCFSGIRNAEFYVNEMSKIDDLDLQQIFDIAMHIKILADSDAFTLEDVIKHINEMPVDEFAELANKFYEQRFSISKVTTVECSNCHHQERFYFDSFPDFFPDGWEIE